MKNKLKGSAFLLLIAILTLNGCKSLKSPKYITNTETLADTLIVHKAESIVLPQRNVVVFENPCKENKLVIANQTIENEKSSISIKNTGDKLMVGVNIDSIVNARLSEASTKSKVERIEIPVEVEVPVRNPINWKILAWAITSTVLLFRKPIWFAIRKIINPIS